MASISLRHIYKIYSGDVTAVTDFNLEIEDKEFIILVGPLFIGVNIKDKLVLRYLRDTIDSDREPLA